GGPSSNPGVTGTAQAMNHPELLSAYWALTFSADPTHVDANGDGQGDWVVHGGGNFDTTTLANGLWKPNGAGIDTNPGDDFSRLTVVDVRFRATAAGGYAGFSINAARSGGTC